MLAKAQRVVFYPMAASGLRELLGRMAEDFRVWREYSNQPLRRPQAWQ